MHGLNFLCESFKHLIRGCSVPGKHKAKKSPKGVRKFIVLTQFGEFGENPQTLASTWGGKERRLDCAPLLGIFGPWHRHWFPHHLTCSTKGNRGIIQVPRWGTLRIKVALSYTRETAVPKTDTRWGKRL